MNIYAIKGREILDSRGNSTERVNINKELPNCKAKFALLLFT
jgi:hypothetical protein